MVKTMKDHKKARLKDYKIKFYNKIYIYIKLILSIITSDKNGKIKNREVHIIQGIISLKSLLFSTKGNNAKRTK